MVRSAPPRIGAIIPPLIKAKTFVEHSIRAERARPGGDKMNGTYIRESAEAIPHAVPRTVEFGGISR